MTGSSLLAALVRTRGMQPEPVATDALVLLLQRSAAARSALEGICSAAGHLTLQGLAFTGQATESAQEGRPDVLGSDASGTRLLIEAKFGAELTPAQEGPEYLNWLAPGSPGALVFLVPRNRMPMIWPRLLAGPAQVVRPPVPDLTHEDRPWLSHDIDGRILVVLPWEGLLSKLEDALSEAIDRSDLQQLSGLVRSQLASAWRPLATGDLPARDGAQLTQLRVCLFQATIAANKPETILPGMADVGTGRYLTHQKKKLFWAGIHTDAWGRYGTSPLWITATGKGAFAMNQLREALSPLEAPGGSGLYQFNATTLVAPLHIQIGAEPGEITTHLAKQLADIKALLAPAVDEVVQEEGPSAGPSEETFEEVSSDGFEGQAGVPDVGTTTDL